MRSDVHCSQRFQMSDAGPPNFKELVIKLTKNVENSKIVKDAIDMASILTHAGASVSRLSHKGVSYVENYVEQKSSELATKMSEPNSEFKFHCFRPENKESKAIEVSLNGLLRIQVEVSDLRPDYLYDAFVSQKESPLVPGGCIHKLVTPTTIFFVGDALPKDALQVNGRYAENYQDHDVDKNIIVVHFPLRLKRDDYNPSQKVKNMLGGFISCPTSRLTMTGNKYFVLFETTKAFSVEKIYEMCEWIRFKFSAFTTSVWCNEKKVMILQPSKKSRDNVALEVKQIAAKVKLPLKVKRKGMRTICDQQGCLSPGQDGRCSRETCGRIKLPKVVKATVAKTAKIVKRREKNTALESDGKRLKEMIAKRLKTGTSKSQAESSQ